MAMRSDCSEAKRRLRASEVVRSLPSSITSPLCESMRHRWEYLSPRSSPAVVGGCTLPTSMVGRSSFHCGRFRACRVFADPLRVLRMGGRPSNLTFGERREREVAANSSKGLGALVPLLKVRVAEKLVLASAPHLPDQERRCHHQPAPQDCSPHDHVCRGRWPCSPLPILRAVSRVVVFVAQ